MTVEDAYAVQQGLVAGLMGEGESIIGYKLGLTSRPMQEMLGVDQPDYAPVLGSTVYADGADVAIGDFISPRMEAEICVVLKDDFSGPRCTVAQAYEATAGLMAALEIVDSRIADWKITLADTISDLASNGAVAFGSRVVPLGDFDPALIGMVFTRNGDLVATGAGAAALGGPIDAVAWLANTLHPLGVSLPAGSIIMTGALHAAARCARAAFHLQSLSSRYLAARRCGAFAAPMCAALLGTWHLALGLARDGVRDWGMKTKHGL